MVEIFQEFFIGQNQPTKMQKKLQKKIVDYIFYRDFPDFRFLF